MSPSNLFIQEFSMTNAISWDICGIDMFYFYIENELKNNFSKFFCLRCASKITKSIKEMKDKYNFFFRYYDKDMDILFKRIEWKLSDPTFVDCGTQQALLIKGIWPTVRLKEDLVEEGQEVLFYTKKPINREDGESERNK